MFSETVAQKPTTPVSDGTKKRKNSAKVSNFEGVAQHRAKTSCFRTRPQKQGKPHNQQQWGRDPCKNRIVSMPRKMTSTLRSQKNIKQIAEPHAKCAHDGASATIIALIASPPIHV